MDMFLWSEAYPSHIGRESSTTLVFYKDVLAGYYTLKPIRVNERFITVESLKEVVGWYKERFNFEHLFQEDIINDEPIMSLVLDLYDEDLLKDYFDLD